MRELLGTVEIPNYVRKVLTAKARLPTYYTKKDKTIPKKYQTGLEEKKLFWIYNAKKKDVLLSNVNGDPIIKNAKSAGTPRYLPIRGNDLHRLTLKDYERSKILDAIKEQMIPFVEKLNIIHKDKFPLRILMEIHTTVIDPEMKTGGRWDVDNHGLWYAKIFPDVLCGCPMAVAAVKAKDGKVIKAGFIHYKSKRIIEDDDSTVIIQPPTPLFIPIENYSDRKLVFKIYSA